MKKYLDKIIREFKNNLIFKNYIRVVLIVSVLFFVLYISISKFIIYHVKRQLIEERLEAQYQFVDNMSNLVSNEVLRIHDILKLIAAKYSGSPNKSLDPFKVITNNQFVNVFFNNGLYIFDGKGKLLYEAPNIQKRADDNYSYRQYISQTVQKQKGIISKPYKSTLEHGHPCLMFTAPIFGEKGTMIAILGGSVDLLRDNFISDHFVVKQSENTKYVMIEDEGSIIYHPSTDSIGKRYNLSSFYKTLGSHKVNAENEYLVSKRVYGTEWSILYSINDNEINALMTNNVVLIKSTVAFVIIMFELIFLILSYRIFISSISFAKQFKRENPLADNFEYFSERAVFITNDNVKRINQFIKQYRQQNSSYKNDLKGLYNVLVHSNYAFVGFEEKTGNIIKYNEKFLELTETNSDEIMAMNINKALFKDFKQYYAAFDTFLQNVYDYTQSDKFYLFKKDKTPIRLLIGAFYVPLYNNKLIILMIREKESLQNYFNDYILQKRIAELLIDENVSNVHLVDQTGKIIAYSGMFKKFIAADKPVEGNYIWDYIHAHKERMQLQQYFNSISLLTNPKKRFLINFVHPQTQENISIRLTYSLIWSENNKECAVVGEMVNNTV
ncbi:MAG: PDC sensor domain-containing protein [Candidatus Cloacimonetes bacterium]|nr:PDC sensor domain-containing protein [Candidatus Cloacimonadota bacterium]